jgi:hypothetical protein
MDTLRYCGTVLRASRLTAFVGVLLALTLLGSSASLGARETTAPGNHVLVYFVINDKKVAYEIFRTTAGGGTDQLFLEKYVVRGDFATFYVINRAKKPHGFDFYGHKIAPLKPGHRTKFNATLLKRGTFPFTSTPAAGKSFRGVFPVY